MNSLERRINKIEKKLDLGQGLWLRFPIGDGEFIEIPGCRTLLDVYAKYIALTADNGNEIQQNPTE